MHQGDVVRADGELPRHAAGDGAREAGLLVGDRRRAAGRVVGSLQCLAKFRSFSAVSAPIFARIYAFCSIFQNLPDYRAEIWQFFANFAALKLAKKLLNFRKKTV